MERPQDDISELLSQLTPEELHIVLCYIEELKTSDDVKAVTDKYKAIVDQMKSN